MPFIIDFIGEPPVKPGVLEANVAHARALGLKSYDQVKARVSRLAVVGGGPSIEQNIEVLGTWPGDIWAINGAWQWCAERGIAAAFFAVDPCPIVAQWARLRAPRYGGRARPPKPAGRRRAILASKCDPAVFALLRDAEVAIYDASGAGKYRGSCAAVAAPSLAFAMGYREVTFFGCEGSYAERSHAYQDEDLAEQMIVACSGIKFRTRPDFYTASRELAAVINEFPMFCREQSGGLLRALIRNKGQHDVIWVSQDLAEQLKPGPAA